MRILRGLEVVKVSVVEKIFKDCAGIFASDSEQPAPQRLELLMLFLRGLSYNNHLFQVRDKLNFSILRYSADLDKPSSIAVLEILF